MSSKIESSKGKHDEGVSNPSDNRPFHDILAAHLSRRTVLTGGLAVAATTVFGAAGTALAAPGRADDDRGRRRDDRRRFRRLMDFRPVKVADGSGPLPSISADYEYQVMIPWGEPLEPGGPAYVQVDFENPGDTDFADLAERQTRQIGIGHDGMTYFPIDRKRVGRDRDGNAGNEHGVLCINHEFGDNNQVIGVPQGQLPVSLDQVRRSQHAHGVSVVEIKKVGGIWQQVKSDFARRIHVNTPVTFSGPVAGHPLLDTPNGNVPLGTANNCANGETPWGTYLTCEENFNGYFGATNAEQPWVPTEAQLRYGFSQAGFGYGWHTVDRRFDLSDQDYVNEENRFGWVVEIDPFDATQTPVKRTALGRFKHEGATVAIGRGGRVVVYMGDDEVFDYIYKFVSADNWQAMLARGESPLDRGTLYAARFDDNGTGEWLPLTMGNPAIAAKFSDMGEVLTFTRLAADAAGATPMDRPEWSAIGPGGTVYFTLTNNSGRTVPDAANPLAPNPDGHIIRFKDSADHTGLSFDWEIFLIAEDTHGTEDTFSDPDGLFADPDGRLFIETDGGQKDGLNNQLLVADTRSGELRRLFTGVTGDEITGLTMTPDRRTLFINTQHPGNGNPNLTNFPVLNAVPDGVTVPRDATFVITRKDGGIIGS